MAKCSLRDIGEPETGQPIRCPIARLQGELDADDLRVLGKWLADTQRYTGVWIVASLTVAGHPVTAAAVQRHRRLACACAEV